MKKKLTASIFALATLLVAVFVLQGPWASAGDEKEPGKKTGPAIAVSDSPPPQPQAPVKKTDEEWKKALTPEQFYILRKAGTERPNGQAYREFKNHAEGTYYCAGCGAELFTSKEKFDSHCGWPSFYDPSKAKNVKFNVDFHLGYARKEVVCKICDGHLGHVFEGEGFPTPTDQRYCINGLVLKFVPKESPSTGAEKKDSPVEEKTQSSAEKKAAPLPADSPDSDS